MMLLRDLMFMQQLLSRVSETKIVIILSWPMLESWFRQTINTPLFRLGQQSISLLWILQIISLFLLVSIIARSIKRFLKNFLLLKLKISEGNREVISTLTSLGLCTLGFIVVLQEMGLDLANFAVIMGGLGIGIGFGLQELTKNLVSGLTILAENKLKVGDLVEFNGNLGYIKEISIRSAVIKTFQGTYLIVPNTDLTSNSVENWNYDNYQGRIEIPIGVAYQTDPLLVTEVLLESASLEKEILCDPCPKVIFKGFGDNSLNFELWVWVARIDRRPFIISSLNFIIEYNFRQRNIIMPFPQRDLWLRNPQDITSLVTQENLLKFSPEDNNHNYYPSLKELLQQFSGFLHLNDLQLRVVIEMGHRIYLQPAEILINQGETNNYFYIVLAGEVQAIYETQKISNRLFTFSAGQYFGELPVMLGVPYPTTMRAATYTTLFKIGKDCFQRLLNQYPHLTDSIAEELAKRQEVLQDYQQKLQSMGLLDNEDVKNPVEWIRQRLIKIFALSKSPT